MIQRTIFKYVLATSGETIVRMPSEATILSAQQQDNKLCVWAIVDVGSNVRFEERKFNAVQTGDAVPANIKKFVGTVQVERPSGFYVCHVFEVA